MASSSAPEDTGLPVDDIAAVRERVSQLTPGEDAVIVETGKRRTLPLAVQAAPTREGWRVPHGDPSEWPARVSVRVAGEQDSTYDLVVDDLTAPPRASLAEPDPDGTYRVAHRVHDLDLVPDVDEWWCGKCGHGPSSARGIRVHDSRNDDHDGDPVVVPHDPDSGRDDEAADEPAEDDGADTPGEAEAGDQYWCGRCGYGPMTERGTKIHNGIKHDGEPILRESEPDPEDFVGDDEPDEEPDDDPDSGAELARDDPDGEPPAEGDDTPAGETSTDDEQREDDEADEPATTAASNYDENGVRQYPAECRCGTVCEDSLEWAVHRTEVHDVPQSRLDHLEAGEFEALVADAATVEDLVDELGWSLKRTLRTLAAYGLDDVVGPSDVELSDITDVDLPAVAGGEQTTPEDKPATQDDDGDAKPADYSGGGRTPHVEFVDAKNLDDRPTQGDRERLAALEFDVPVPAEDIFAAVHHPDTRTIADVAARLDWDANTVTGRVRTILFQLDLYDELPEPEGHRSPEAGGRPA